MKKLMAGISAWIIVAGLAIGVTVAAGVTAHALVDLVVVGWRLLP